jgi:hypothetical protein
MSAALPNSDLAISDSKACKQWLESLPLTNVQQAHLAITSQLVLLNGTDKPSSETVKVLEMLREPIDFLQTEFAKKVLQKPLPFNATEQAIWDSMIVLWQTIYRAYEKCYEALEDGRLSGGHAALVCHRCIRYTTQLMFEHFRVYQEFEPILWLQLHKYYLYAESQRCDDTAIKDPLNHQVDATSCYAAYTQGLLLHYANPFDLSTRQQQQMDRWLDRLSQKIRPNKAFAADSPVPSLAVDTEMPAGLAPATQINPGSTVRYLNMEKLSSSLRKRVKLLRSGAPASELDLGEDCVQPNCEALLVYLHQQWCETPPARSSQRQQKNEKIQLCFGIPGIHYFITGRSFGQPNKPKSLSSKEMQEIAIFGRVSSQENKAHISQLGFAIETWDTLDESLGGYRLSRDAKSGIRISSKQIVAARPPADPAFVLGSIRWLMLDLDGKLMIGIQVFQGTVQAVSVRPAGINAINEKFTQAFMLSPLPSSQELPSLILPPRLYQPNRYIELNNETTQNVKLLDSLDRGNDYERVTFVID